jgi:metal-sulfur cluster biosynthetic enzyme
MNGPPSPPRGGRGVLLPGDNQTMAVSEDQVRESLKQVIDPELFVNIVDLGLVYCVSLEPRAEGGQQVKIEMTMTSPMCPAGPQLIAQSKQVVGQLEGVGGVEVKIVFDPPWTPDRMTDDARDQLGIF